MSSGNSTAPGGLGFRPRIQPLRFVQDPPHLLLDLLPGPIPVQRRISIHPAPVHRHPSQLHQSRLPTQLHPLPEQPLELLQVPLPEVGDRPEVRLLVRRKSALSAQLVHHIRDEALETLLLHPLLERRWNQTLLILRVREGG